MPELARETIVSFDGTQLAVFTMGEGRPVVLLHGLFSDALLNWVKYGHARRLASAGFQAIMPDLRAHGDSAAPHDAAAYPQDVLARDIAAIIAHFGLAPGGFDLAGFSLGARTAASAVVSGLRPRSLTLAGMGLEGLAGWAQRAAFFIDAIDRYDTIKHGDPAFFAKAFMKTQQTDRIAARLLLQAVDDVEPEALSAVTMPSLVLCGAEDRDNGDPEALARALPQGHLVWIPGSHMSSVTEPMLGESLVTFLSELT